MYIFDTVYMPMHMLMIMYKFCKVHVLATEVPSPQGLHLIGDDLVKRAVDQALCRRAERPASESGTKYRTCAELSVETFDNSSGFHQSSNRFLCNSKAQERSSCRPRCAEPRPQTNAQTLTRSNSQGSPSSQRSNSDE